MAEKKKTTGIAKKSNPALWSRVKAAARKKFGGHSAVAMAWASREYKKRGGKYSGSKPDSSKNRMRKWLGEKWRTADGSKSKQKGKAAKRFLPSKAFDAMSPSEVRQANKTKAEGTRKKKKYVSNPKKLKQKLKRYR